MHCHIQKAVSLAAACALSVFPATSAFAADEDDTPRVNNLLAAGLLTKNPNSIQPFRLDRSQAVTCDQDHNYGDEQKAFDRGRWINFPNL